MFRHADLVLKETSLFLHNTRHGVLRNDALNAFESTIVEADEWWRSFQDDWLSIHREDICIYRVRLERSGSGWSIAEAWTNGDPEQFKLSLSEKVQLLFYFIDRILLLDKKTGEL